MASTASDQTLLRNLTAGVRAALTRAITMIETDDLVSARCHLLLADEFCTFTLSLLDQEHEANPESKNDSDDDPSFSNNFAISS